MVSGLFLTAAFALAAFASPKAEPLPSPFFLSVPMGAAEPLIARADVQFVSNGYYLEPRYCVVTKSSGSELADRQACLTVNFRRASKPVNASAPVWIADAHPNFVPPLSSSKKPPVTTNDYPSKSLNKGEQGTAVVRLIVGVDGKPRDCSTAASSGYPALDYAAQTTLCRKLKLHPATLDGTPVESINYTQVEFYQGN